MAGAGPLRAGTGRQPDNNQPVQGICPVLTKDRISGLFFLAISIAYGALAFDIRQMPFGASDVFTPRTLPFGLALMGILISTAIVLRPSPSEKAAATPWASFAWHRVILLALDMLAYAFLITRIGFMASTTLFLIVGYLILGERRPWMLAVASLPVAIVFWLLLDQLLDIYLGPLLGQWGPDLSGGEG